MSSIKNPANFWGGAVVVGIGAIVVYFGLDFPNTNLKTFVYPELIAATLVIIGWVTIGIGVITMLFGYLRSHP